MSFYKRRRYEETNYNSSRSGHHSSSQEPFSEYNHRYSSQRSHPYTGYPDDGNHRSVSESSHRKDRSRRKERSHDSRKKLSETFVNYKYNIEHDALSDAGSADEPPFFYCYESKRKRSRSRSATREIDKEKLLRIARENLEKMIEKGEVSGDKRDVNKMDLDKIKQLTTQKSLSQWTQLCDRIVRENDGHYSSNSDHSDSESARIDRPTSSLRPRDPRIPGIQIKVRDFNQLESRTAKQVQKDLLDQFPVSSGSQHRFKELEWKPVEPPPQPQRPQQKSNKLKRDTSLKNDETPSTFDNETNPNLPETGKGFQIELGTIMSQRLSAMRRLQENPCDVVALKQIYSAQEMMQEWTQSQIQQGQFIGSTGAHCLKPDELEPVVPAWTKKNQFKNAEKIKDGVGLQLLLKMGWKEGTGLGKNNEGLIEPIVPSLKFDTKGLASEDERAPKVPLQLISASTGPDSKNPISMLQEHCAKKRWPIPFYELIQSNGPCHRPTFLTRVTVNSVQYEPSIPSPNKKQAKAMAAAVCLQSFGLLPSNES
ncbi:protein Son-like [Brevipalpus obovatus]|uniref:protein Son-like n=1 Tax=Brevipalpus obovatus TaxID=246614 RepID=UPI003D9F9DC1